MFFPINAIFDTLGRNCVLRGVRNTFHLESSLNMKTFMKGIDDVDFAFMDKFNPPNVGS